MSNIDDEKQDENGRIKPGQTLNPNGAPKGPRRGMTTKQRAETLSRGSKLAMEKLLALVGDKDPKVALKAATAWLTEDYKFRQLVLDEVEQEIKIRKMKQELKEGGGDKTNQDAPRESKARVLSLTKK